MTPKMKALPVITRKAVKELPPAPEGMLYFAIGDRCWGHGPTADKALAASRSNGSGGWFVLHLLNRGASVDQVDGTVFYHSKTPGLRVSFARVRCN